MQGEGLKKLQSGQPISTREQLLLIAQLSWPAILAQISSVVMQYIDTAMVGQLGEQATAAVSTSGPQGRPSERGTPPMAACTGTSKSWRGMFSFSFSQMRRARG